MKPKLLRALLAYSVVGAGITVAPAAYFGGQLATFAFLLVALLVLPLLQGRSGAGHGIEDDAGGGHERDAGGSPAASVTSDLPTDLTTVLTLYLVGVVPYSVAALALLR